jgi:hypothetical protein
MKLYYDGIGYPCKLKSEMKGNNTWYSMEPISIKLTFPKYIYDKILLDIKLDNENKTLRDIFRFKLLLQKGELSRNKDNWNTHSQVVQNEFWKLETYLDGLTITSKFRNGDVTAKFSLSIFSEMELDKSELRELILNQLI